MEGTFGLQVRCAIRPSSIGGAGRGLFLREAVARGQLLYTPDKSWRLYTFAELAALPPGSHDQDFSQRLGPDLFAASPEDHGDNYINHSFAPNCLWHLGWIFAREALPAGTELTLDYRYFTAEQWSPVFVDSASGRPVAAFPWAEAVATSAATLAELLRQPSESMTKATA